MYKMLQIDEPGTFVLATNQTQTVRDFVSLAFNAIDIDLVWEGKEDKEIGKDSRSGKTLIKVNPQFYRPAEVDLLIGDASKANEKLNWKPKTSLKELCTMMVKKDLERNQNGGTF